MLQEIDNLLMHKRAINKDIVIPKEIGKNIKRNDCKIWKILKIMILKN